MDCQSLTLVHVLDEGTVPGSSGGGRPVTSIAFFGACDLILVSSMNGMLSCWSSSNGSFKSQKRVSQDPVASIAFSQRHGCWFSLSSRGYVMSWKTGTGGKSGSDKIDSHYLIQTTSTWDLEETSSRIRVSKKIVIHSQCNLVAFVHLFEVLFFLCFQFF